MMDKDTILSYLREINEDLEEGKLIRAHKTLRFVLINIEMDINKTKNHIKRQPNNESTKGEQN